MTGYRKFAATFSVASLALAGLPATAQDDDGALRDSLRDCAQIAGLEARVACYDALARGEAASAQATAAAPEPASFGSNQVPRPRAPSRDSGTGGGEIDAIQAEVAAAVQREPGIHLLTLADGAQWLFVDPVPLSYSTPRRGSTVEIRSAAMGSYLLRYRNQSAVRIRRIR